MRPHCFFGVKTLNPLAKTSTTLSDLYKYHENLKKLKDQQIILDVEQSCFVPITFLCTGGAPQVAKVMQRLAEKIEKKLESSADVMIYIQTKISLFQGLHINEKERTSRKFGWNDHTRGKAVTPKSNFRNLEN